MIDGEMKKIAKLVNTISEQIKVETENVSCNLFLSHSTICTSKLTTIFSACVGTKGFFDNFCKLRQHYEMEPLPCDEPT